MNFIKTDSVAVSSLLDFCVNVSTVHLLLNGISFNEKINKQIQV